MKWRCSILSVSYQAAISGHMRTRNITTNCC
ncbi:hypothetical protein F-M6_0113 [Faustovirus]|nr:hypothetical protein F-M6_0113 [Faustovirus]